MAQHLGVAVETDGFISDAGEAKMRPAVVLRLDGFGRLRGVGQSVSAVGHEQKLYALVGEFEV